MAESFGAAPEDLALAGGPCPSVGDGARTSRELLRHQKTPRQTRGDLHRSERNTWTMSANLVKKRDDRSSEETRRARTRTVTPCPTNSSLPSSLDTGAPMMAHPGALGVGPAVWRQGPVFPKKLPVCLRSRSRNRTGWVWTSDSSSRCLETHRSGRVQPSGQEPSRRGRSHAPACRPFTG